MLSAVFVPLGFAALFSIAMAVGLVAWFNAQPYSIHEHLGEGVQQLLKFSTNPSVGGSLLKIRINLRRVESLQLMSIFPKFWHNAPTDHAPAFRSWAIGLVCLLPVGLLWPAWSEDIWLALVFSVAG